MNVETTLAENEDHLTGTARVESVIAGTKKKQKVILHPMSVKFPEGEVTAILGPSGSGKR
jgi:ABC-type lipoprotein export system ATPase subunit